MYDRQRELHVELTDQPLRASELRAIDVLKARGESAADLESWLAWPPPRFQGVAVDPEGRIIRGSDDTILGYLIEVIPDGAA